MDYKLIYGFCFSYLKYGYNKEKTTKFSLVGPFFRVLQIICLSDSPYSKKLPLS